jgi:hypothetical protein
MTVRSVQLRAGTLVLTPLQIFGSVSMWVNAGLQASASQVVDQAQGIVFTAAGGITYGTTGPNGLPIWSANGTDGIFSGALNRPAPATEPSFIIGVWRQDGFTAGDCLYGTGSQTLALAQSSPSPNLAQRNTTVANSNGGGGLNTWFLSYQLFTGSTSDFNVCGNTVASGEDSGNTDPGATFSFFGRTTANFAAASLYELSILPFLPNDSMLRLYKQRIRVLSGNGVIGTSA